MHNTNRTPFIWIPLACVVVHASAQTTDSSAAGMLDKVTAAIHAHDGWQYDATMHFQTSGSDTFEVREFTVAFKWNEGNAIYPYDWSVSEARNSGRFTFMVLPGSLYTVVDKARFMGHRTLTEPFEEGVYYWTLRSYLLWDEVIAPFRTNAENVHVSDSSGYVVLSVQTHPTVNQYLAVDRESWLPVRSIDVIHDEGFGFVQTNDIEFRHSMTPGSVADSMLSPQYYLDKGYRFDPPPTDVVQDAEEKEALSISAENTDILLAYPFLTAGDNEVRLNTEDARFILLDFWYASCLPCLRAMPEVQRVADEMKPDLAVYAVNCFDSEIRANLTNRMRQKGITMPLLFGEKELVKTLGINVYPTYLLITPDRRIRIIRGGAEEVRRMMEQDARK